MERRLLLDVVVAERTAVLQLLTREDKTLLVRRNTLLVLDLGLHIVDRVRRLDLERDRSYDAKERVARPAVLGALPGFLQF